MKSLMRMRYAVIGTMIVGALAVATPAPAEAARTIRGSEIRSMLNDLRAAVKSRDVQAIRVNVRQISFFIRNRVSPN